MKNLTKLLITTLAGALALTGAACGSKSSSSGTGGSGDTTGNGGAGGSTGGVPPGDIPLPSSATGFVQDLTGGSNVIGPWYAYGDGVGPNANVNGADATNSDCQSTSKGDFPASACTQIATPTPGQPFMPFNAGTSQMCTSGIAAQVMNKGGSPDYSDLWGGGISLDLNNPGGDAGVKGDIDLSAYKGMYFDFSVYPSSAPMSNGAGAPPGAMRVNFPFTGEYMGDNSPYWMGASKASSPLTPPTDGTAQHIEVDWSDVGGPYYLTQQSPAVTPPAFDPKHVQSIQFQVFTGTSATTPYAFCVANLALIPN
jgi:hypothetical protein